MTTSRTAMRVTGTHQNTPSATRATRAPSTRTLSARGSRKAPELVLPWRRATHPSRASLPATAIHTRRVDQAAPRSTMRTMTTGASSSRAAVNALAGVARAEGPNDSVRRGLGTDDADIGLRRLEVGLGCTEHRRGSEGFHWSRGGAGTESVELMRHPMAARHRWCIVQGI